MRLVNTMLSLAALGLLTSSCNNVDFKKTKGGMPYKVFESKDGKKIQPGNYIKANITQKVKDSTVFSTYESMPMYLQVTESSQPYDISEVLPTLKQGDSVYAVQLIDTFMARNPSMVPPTFKKGDKITTTIKVLDVYPSAEAYKKDEEGDRQNRLKTEDATIKSYLDKNNIQAQKVGNGTYVQVLQPGQGTPVTEGKYVSMMYKGTTLAGKEFDSNMSPKFGHTDPLSFVVGGSGMIKGFEEGLLQLKQGAKARFFIPSMLAYGPQAPSPDIKPFENLIFDVEVTNVQDKAPAQKSMGQPNIDTTQVH